jgi:hypothetical protein
MAGFFERGQETKRRYPVQPSQADAATRLMVMQLLMQRLGQTPFNFAPGAGGMPAGGAETLATAKRPGAFRAGPEVTKTKPAGFSLGEELMGGATTLALLLNLIGGGGGIGAGISNIGTGLGKGYDWISSFFGDGGSSGFGIPQSIGAGPGTYQGGGLGDFGPIDYTGQSTVPDYLLANQISDGMSYG